MRVRGDFFFRRATARLPLTDSTNESRCVHRPILVAVSALRRRGTRTIARERQPGTLAFGHARNGRLAFAFRVRSWIDLQSRVRLLTAHGFLAVVRHSALSWLEHAHGSTQSDDRGPNLRQEERQNEGGSATRTTIVGVSPIRENTARAHLFSATARFRRRACSTYGIAN